jgi:hypothetical protein
MISNNLAQVNNVLQVSKEGTVMTYRISFTKLIHNLIREYGQYAHGSFEINVSDLVQSDKRLVLSHILDSEEYAWACESHIRADQLFNEYLETIQQLFDDECYSVYCDAMEEHGMRYVTSSNNDDVYWVRG